MRKPIVSLDKNRVPILSNQRIDEYCEGLIREFHPGVFEHPEPVDIDAFVCFFLGMKQDFAYLSNDGRYLGMTVFNDTDRVIIYDPERNRAEYMSAEAGTVIIDNTLLEEKQIHRYRFTMGHEGGHGIWHPDHFSYTAGQVGMFDEPPQAMVQCRADASKTLYTKDWKSWTPEDRMEQQANKSASALLMPREAVYKLVRRLPTARRMDEEVSRVMAVANTFNVSMDAAMYRLFDLGVLKRKIPMAAALDFSDFIEM